MRNRMCLTTINTKSIVARDIMTIFASGKKPMNLACKNLFS